MPKHQRLLRRLSDAGIAPRYLLRIDAELQDHYADLEREAFVTEKTAAEAAAEARLRLGDDEEIAAEFLAHPELKLWIYRWPITRFGLGLLVGVLIALLAPLQLIVAKRATIARFGLAACVSVVLLVVTLLGMQRIVDLDRRVTGARSFAIERHESTDLAPVRPEKESVKNKLPSFAQRRSDSPAPIGLDGTTAAISLETFVRTTFDVRELGIGELNGDYLPIVKVAAIYPALALAQGLEGYVVVQFTVARSGAVKDVVVVESTDSLFERAAVEAAYKYKYRPRVIRGQSVEVPGVRNRISFDIAV